MHAPLHRPHLFAAAALAAALTFAAPAGASGIFGVWMRDDGNARVRIAPCGNEICAINVWVRDPVRQNEAVGDRLVFRIKRAGASDDDWTGTAYDPRRDVRLTASLNANGETMTTRGCVLGGLLCRSTVWTRN